jgi:hypothetical protein
MTSFLRVVIPSLQTPSDGQSVEALRQEVVKEQLKTSALPQSNDSQQADESVTDTSSPTSS